MEAVRALLNWRSLGWKIAALVAVSSCAVALVVGLLVHRATAERQQDEGKREAIEAVQAAVADTGSSPKKKALQVGVGVPSQLRRLGAEHGWPAAWYDDQSPGGPWMWAGQLFEGKVVAARIDMSPRQESLQAFDRSIVKAVLVALLVVVPFAAAATEFLSRRMRRVAGTARRIAGGDLDARIGGGRGGDEIAAIAEAVDSMAASLQRRLLTEQRFTADVAHELRTPLMGLVTSAGLLPDGEATTLVRDRVSVLRGLVEDLLEISRLDAGAEEADLRAVPLVAVVEDSLARTGLDSFLTTGPATGHTATGHTATGHTATVHTDPRRLDRIVANLVGNAHKHGRAPVEVRVDGATIVVRDHGPGFPAVLLDEGPQRFRTGAAERGRGHGLGLTIALGQARVLGADLTLANAPDGGAVAVLRLPEADTRPIHS
ncbi:HAMP domain-containing histidine kinase [Actinomadura barringtoniae]|uniref:histidine kinase n=1 Tax=Actinomadura barringtoniae TaxID=1427535 RepID=A0A939P673_9ACTN|nr:HAMP domain-containing sensor histidine kinase [Actinomadura barringtoniae]MBO2445532.1 HAMP domain-containing histidine kinase [Actinomadura barringtoniae]